MEELAEEAESAREELASVVACDCNLPTRSINDTSGSAKNKNRLSANAAANLIRLSRKFAPPVAESSLVIPIHLFRLIFGIIGTHPQSRKEAYRTCIAPSPLIGSDT